MLYLDYKNGVNIMTKTRNKANRKPKVILKKGQKLNQKQMDMLLEKFKNAGIPIIKS